MGVDVLGIEGRDLQLLGALKGTLEVIKEMQKNFEERMAPRMTDMEVDIGKFRDTGNGLANATASAMGRVEAILGELGAIEADTRNKVDGGWGELERQVKTRMQKRESSAGERTSLSTRSTTVGGSWKGKVAAAAATTTNGLGGATGLGDFEKKGCIY